MNWRALLTLGAGAACVLAAKRPVLADLNPDRMWPVYRRYHLLIVAQRDDERSGALTAAVVDVLSRYLPASRPQLVSAADARRIGVLIATNQQDVAIMQADSVHARSSCGIKTAAQCLQAIARATAKDEVSDAPRPCTPTAATSSARVPSVSDDDAVQRV